MGKDSWWSLGGQRIGVDVKAVDQGHAKGGSHDARDEAPATFKHFENLPGLSLTRARYLDPCDIEQRIPKFPGDVVGFSVSDVEVRVGDFL